VIGTIIFLKAIKKSNTCCIEELILRNRQITICDITSNSGITVRSVETIVLEHLFFKKVCAQ
jgi:hypothetical protein